MRGPAAGLFRAGAEGKHLNNIRRDWFRKIGDHHAAKLNTTCLTGLPT